MSNLIRAQIWHIPFPNIEPKLLALYLADRAKDDGVCPAIPLSEIAGMTGLALASVKRWHAALEACGLLKVIERSKGGPQHYTKRAFNIPRMRQLMERVKGRALFPPEGELIADRRADGSLTLRVAVYRGWGWRETRSARRGTGITLPAHSEPVREARP